VHPDVSALVVLGKSVRDHEIRQKHLKERPK
jgi:hypothetical protein